MTALRDGAPYLPDLPLPPVTGTNAGFWKAAAEGRLDVQRCHDCGAHRHPPTEGCYRCGSLAWDWDTLPGTGTVFTYTWVVQPLHPAVEPVVPYNVSVVEVDGASDEPVRLASNVVDATEETLYVGSRVTLACDKITDEVGLPRFRLA
ncbi:MAG TPA: OB-fold domain-containing protein [Acidimicrobiia bacterium]|nr:OB-fold domain-containing protein [Acidimicrobiia bacterium]